MISYWEKTSFITYDYLIIGGGIVGHFAALELAQQQPNAKIALLEKGLFPHGASTKNAGFACFGSLTELEADEHTLSIDAQLQLVEQRLNGLEQLRQILGDTTIDYSPCGGYELLFDTAENLEARCERWNSLLQPLIGSDTFYNADQEIAAQGFSTKHVKHMVGSRFEGTINTGKMMYALSKKVASLGVMRYTQSEVIGWEPHPTGVHVNVRVGDESLALQAKKVGVCTNAFTKKWLPELDLNPGRGCVLISTPIPNFSLKGCFHYQEGYYYFRSIDQRLLIGGGRQLAFEEETTTQFGINPKIKAALVEDVQRFILPNTPFKIEQEWSGIMGFGPHKKPIITTIDDRVTLGIRLGGMGVAIGASVGTAVAEKMYSN